LIGDVFVRLALGNQPQDFGFTLRQSVVNRVLSELAADRSRQRLLSRMDCTDCVQKLLLDSILEEVSACAGLESAEGLNVTAVRSQYDDTSIGKLVTDRDNRVGTAHSRHLDVHQRHVRALSAELLNRVAAVRALRHHDHIGLAGYERLDSGTEERMIVDGE